MSYTYMFVVLRTIGDRRYQSGNEIVVGVVQAVRSGDVGDVFLVPDGAVLGIADIPRISGIIRADFTDVVVVELWLVVFGCHWPMACSQYTLQFVEARPLVSVPGR